MGRLFLQEEIENYQNKVNSEQFYLRSSSAGRCKRFEYKQTKKNECLSSDARFLFNNLSSRADYVPGALSPY